MVNRSRLTDGITVEDVVLTLENVLLDDVVVCLVDGEDQSNNTVTSVLSHQGVTVDTRLGVGVVLEGIGTTFTHAVTDGVKYLLKYINLQSVEVFLSVNSRIVSVETCIVVFLGLSVPSVGPNERQVIPTNGSDSVYSRMNGQLENSRAVTAGRCQCAVGNRRGLTERIAVEDVVTTLKNIFADDIVVGLVNRQDKGLDAVTSVSSAERVAVNTRLFVLNAVEVIVIAFADGSADGIEQRFINNEL